MADWHSVPVKYHGRTAEVSASHSALSQGTQPRIFRALAHNDVGSSEAGPRSEPVLPHHHLSAAVQPPIAEATSSASVRLTALHEMDASCAIDDGIRFEVLMRREGSDKWNTLTQFGPKVRLTKVLHSLAERLSCAPSWKSTKRSSLLSAFPQGTFLPAKEGIEVGGVRCPLGCYFKLHALNISGWTTYSRSSKRVHTPPAPPYLVGLDSAR